MTEIVLTPINEQEELHLKELLDRVEASEYVKCDRVFLRLHTGTQVECSWELKK